MDDRLRPSTQAHVGVLAAVLDEAPPVLVLVDGDDHRLLDGFMRVEAARALGRSTVRVEYVTGHAAEAWERAIRANATHGMPLSAKQRRAAAQRLLDLAPEWSDRRIASACGVDPRSVARWRKPPPGQAGAEMPQARSADRVGRDGRRYPSAEELDRRRAVARVELHERPQLSDREVGRRAGLSAAAVRRVRSDALSAGAKTRSEGPRRVVATLRRLLRPPRRALRRLAWLAARLLRA